MWEFIQVLIPPDVSALAFGFLVVMSFFASALTAAIGVGGGVALLAIMGNMIPATALIPVHGVIQLGSNAGRLLTLLGFADWRMIGWFSLGSLVGGLLGGQVVASIPPEAIQLALGLFILYSTWLPVFQMPTTRRFILYLGGGTGFLSIIVGGMGPFIFVVLKELFTDRRGLLATVAAMNSVQQVLRASIWGLVGFAFADWWALIVLMVATGFMGTLTGKQFLNRVSAEAVQPILKPLLSILALRLVYMGAAGLWAAS